METSKISNVIFSFSIETLKNAIFGQIFCFMKLKNNCINLIIFKLSHKWNLLFHRVIGASFLLCLNSKKFYKRWNKEMKKTYGKFATADVCLFRNNYETFNGFMTALKH